MGDGQSYSRKKGKSNRKTWGNRGREKVITRRETRRGVVAEARVGRGIKGGLGGKGRCRRGRETM